MKLNLKRATTQRTTKSNLKEQVKTQLIGMLLPPPPKSPKG